MVPFTFFEFAVMKVVAFVCAFMMVYMVGQLHLLFFLIQNYISQVTYLLPEGLLLAFVLAYLIFIRLLRFVLAKPPEVIGSPAASVRHKVFY